MEISKTNNIIFSLFCDTACTNNTFGANYSELCSPKCKKITSMEHGLPVAMMACKEIGVRLVSKTEKNITGNHHNKPTNGLYKLCMRSYIFFLRLRGMLTPFTWHLFVFVLLVLFSMLTFGYF